ncbi:hypothetical protein NL676_014577 [Syzygium grande]|nr:hypothetical protein NL676_014577 [Syzygium grande]
MTNPHDKSLDQKHGTTRLESSVVHPPNRPRVRRVDSMKSNIVAVSRGNDMATEATNRGSGSSAPRGRRRLWGQRRGLEPDPPAEVAQAARVLRRKTNPKLPELPRPCGVCSLKFHCWRELFAHMRTHPEKASRCMREIFPPLDSPAEGEARNHHHSGVEGGELVSTLPHMLPWANKDGGDQNEASSTPGRDFAAESQGAGTSGSAASASPPRRGSGFNFDLNKPPPEEEDNDDHNDGGLDSKELPPEVDE